jgi:hypothetical protein
MMAKYVIYKNDKTVLSIGIAVDQQFAWVVMFTDPKNYDIEYYICVPHEGEAFLLRKIMY